MAKKKKSFWDAYREKKKEKVNYNPLFMVGIGAAVIGFAFQDGLLIGGGIGCVIGAYILRRQNEHKA